MIVRKHLKRIALISLLILCMSIPVLASGSNFKIFIDEKEISFNEGIGFPELKAGRTMIPIRIVSENMGYKVDWNKDNWANDKTILISNTDRKITLKIGESTAVVNGKKVNIDERDGKVVDTKSYISSQNRTMVPVRFIAETMGAKVDYDKKGDIHHIIITTKGNSGVISDKDDGKVVEKPIEKPVEPDVEDKDWIEPEWDFVNGMESDRSLKLYLNNDEEFIKRNARFSTKMVGPTSKKYRYLN